MERPSCGQSTAPFPRVHAADQLDRRPGCDRAGRVRCQRRYVDLFGDRSSASIPDGSGQQFQISGSHVYETPGQYTATITVALPDGDSVSATVPVTVRAASIEAVGEFAHDALAGESGTWTLASFREA